MANKVAWGFLTVSSLLPGLYLVLLGQTGPDMLRGAGLLAISGFSLSRTIRKLTNKTEDP